ncbi:MAG: alpha/beta hydrolase [Rhodospirillales bacterium]|nr:alpha/beta hydrolase [Rhodospirillales bacterium]MCB9995772.1 alpha/beta hydrolase [Rhodospirillales bacterium]
MTFLIAGSLLLYLGFILLMYLAQRSFIYFPEPNTQDRAVYNAGDMDVITVETEDGLTLSGWYKAPEGDKPVIVVFHGNASHMGMSAWKVRDFMDAGYGALLPAYRGYAGNPGKPAEQGLYKDAKAFVGWLRDDRKLPDNRIVLYGESLGTGIAVEMAANHFPEIRGLILESPYTSFVDMARRQYFFVPFLNILVRDQYRSIEKIGRVKAPLLVISGKRDIVVPFRMGQAVYDAANDPKEMLAVPLAGHNDLYMHGVGPRVLHFLSGLKGL